MTSRKMNWIFGFLQGMYWMSYCIVFPFLVRMCSDFGYDDFQSGVVLTGATIANLVMQPIVGSICDRLPRIKPLFCGMFLTGAGLSLLIYVGKKSFPVLFVTVLLLSACIQTLQYIIDIWSVRISSTGIAYNYGFSRSFGSVFYAVTAVVFGIALDSFGFDILPPVFMITAFLTVCVAVMVNEKDAATMILGKRNQNKEKKQNAVPFLKACGMLLKNRKYMVFLIAYFIMQMGNLPVYNYVSRIYEELGAGTSLFGVALFTMAISEVPMLLLLKWLKARIKAETLVLISFIGMILRVLLMAFVMHPIWLTVSFLSQSISYGIFIGAMIYYMAEIVEPEILFTAQTVFAAVSIGLSGIIGNLLGGYYAKAVGVLPMMKLFTLFTVAGCLFFMGACLLKRKKKV